MPTAEKWEISAFSLLPPLDANVLYWHFLGSRRDRPTKCNNGNRSQINDHEPPQIVIARKTAPRHRAGLRTELHLDSLQCPRF